MAAAVLKKEDSALSCTVREFGGGFSKSSRFSKSENGVVGPKYELKEKDHVHSLRMEKPCGVNKFSKYGENPRKAFSNPYNGRSGYLLGSNAESTGFRTVIKDIADQIGPVAVIPGNFGKPVITRNFAPRMVFGREKKFLAVDKLTITKEMLEMNKCMGSPGPKYQPKYGLIDYTKHSPISTTFGSGSLKNSGAQSIERKFMYTDVRGDFLYEKESATGPAVSSHNYTPKVAITEDDTAFRQAGFNKADRFRPTEFLAPHTKDFEIPLVNLGSPGPQHYSIKSGVEVAANGAHRMSSEHGSISP